MTSKDGPRAKRVKSLCAPSVIKNEFRNDGLVNDPILFYLVY